jgi:hypothetical protein
MLFDLNDFKDKCPSVAGKQVDVKLYNKEGEYIRYKPTRGCWYGRMYDGDYDVCLLLEAEDLDKIDTSIYINIITRKVYPQVETSKLYVVQFDVTLRDTELPRFDVGKMMAEKGLRPKDYNVKLCVDTFIPINVPPQVETIDCFYRPCKHRNCIIITLWPPESGDSLDDFLFIANNVKHLRSLAADAIEYSEHDVSYWSDYDMNNGQSWPEPLIQLFIKCQLGPGPHLVLNFVE